MFTFFPCDLVFSLELVSNKKEFRMQENTSIYFASSLFSARESMFNSILTECFENDGYNVYLPQRDGFEFFRLEESLKKHTKSIVASEISTVLETIIYLLDIGWFVHKSAVVVASLDEPIDPGVVVEQMFARSMGKLVICYRTDTRSPFGTLGDALRGTHFFPVYQSDYFISYTLPAKSPEERDAQIKELYELLKKGVETAVETGYVSRQTSHTQAICERAELLFSGIADIHSHAGISMILDRYLLHKEWIEELSPHVLC